MAFLKRPLSFLAKRPVVACIVATTLFIFLVVGLLHYADILAYNFLPGRSGLLTGLGRHQPLLQSLVQYDSNHYIWIAKNGYKLVTDAAFLPLFPLTIRLIHSIVGSYQVAALLATWLALYGAVIVAYKWVAFELKARKTKLSPWITLGLVAIFPTAFYLAIPYTESLFILLSVGALYAFRRNHYLLATIAALLASLTKYQGLALAVFFAVDYWYSTKQSYKKLLPIVGSVGGFGCYMAYLQMHYGSAFEFVKAESAWGRLHSSVLSNLVSSFRPEYIWFIPVIVLALWSVFQYLGKAYFWYSLTFVLIPLLSGQITALDRYMLSVLPIFLALSLAAVRLKNNIVKHVYTSTSFFFAAWFIMLYANGYIVQ